MTKRAVVREGSSGRKRGLISDEEAHDLCTANRELDARVRTFLNRVRSVGEESVTDYLLWQWSELDARFDYLIARPHTKREEKVTGTDVEIELWLVGRTKALTLFIQAKKFTQAKRNYRLDLRYPDDSRDQLSALLAHASRPRSRGLPFYLIYASEGAGVGRYALHLVGAREIEELVGGPTKAGRTSRKVLALDVISKGQPLHELFCERPVAFEYMFRPSVGFQLGYFDWWLNRTDDEHADNCDLQGRHAV